MIRSALVALALIVTAAPVVAGPWEDAVAAYDSGDYETALRLMRPLAEQGEARAQANLGLMYATGRGVPQDDAEAVKWYRRAAEQGNAKAQTSLGWMYANGSGVPQDDVEAAKWYRLAIEQGDALAQASLDIMLALSSALVALDADFDKGLAAVRTGDYQTALENLLPLAELGDDATAQTILGLMYANGKGVPQDYAEAVKWYRKAAEQGHAEAQTNLGYMYRTGRGVAQDDAEAVKWWRRAAEQNYAQAQTILGLMYDTGSGVPQDDVLAHMWFNLAAAQGNEMASGERDKVAERMTREQIAEAQKLAREWKPK